MFSGECRCCRTMAFEFLGCLWHGCPRCFKNRECKLPGGDRTVEEAYDSWQKKEQLLKMDHAEVIAAWECDVDSDLRKDKEMREFFKSCTAQGPMEPREALYGGRTNAVRLYYKAGDGEVALYVDVRETFSNPFHIYSS